MNQRKAVRASSINGTLTQLQAVSPNRPRPNNTHALSPASHKHKFVSQTTTKQTVSYGELQMVLQNVQEIRKKASQQVKALTQRNQQLETQISDLRVENGQLRGKLSSRDMQWEDSVRIIEQQRNHMEQRVSEMERECKQARDRARTLEDRVRELESSLSREQGQRKEGEKKCQGWEKQWRQAFTVLAGDWQRGEQLIRRMKTEHRGSKDLWEILDDYRRIEITARQYQERQARLKLQIEEAKQNGKQSTGLLEKSFNEMSSLHEKVRETEGELVGWRERQDHWNDQRHALLQEITSIKTTLQDCEMRWGQRQAAWVQERRGLLGRIEECERWMVDRQVRTQQTRKRSKYQDLVEEICADEGLEILQRVRYLQKFRQEHYFNVQKIQHLCKMLDQ